MSVLPVTVSWSLTPVAVVEKSPSFSNGFEYENSNFAEASTLLQIHWTSSVEREAVDPS